MSPYPFPTAITITPRVHPKKIMYDRKRLAYITFDRRWVNSVSLVVRSTTTLESSFSPLPAHGDYFGISSRVSKHLFPCFHKLIIVLCVTAPVISLLASKIVPALILFRTLRFLKIFVLKRSFFQAAVTSILLYGCTTWTLTKRLEKKLDGNYTRMLHAILNKSWRQHPTRHQLYGHLPPITETIQVRRTRHAGHCWRSRDELLRDVLLWTPIHGRAKAGRPARTYIQQLCEDTGCCPEDLPRAMNDREEWRERVRDIRATSAIWWWWWLYSQYCNHISFPHCAFLCDSFAPLV